MIKLNLIENPLQAGAYMFQVSTEDSLNTADICRRSVANNGKVDYNTMMAAIAQYEDQVEKDLLDGKMINNRLFHGQACAHGSASTGKPTWGGDPNHYLEPRFTATPAFKTKLNHQTVEVMGVKHTGPEIFDIYDYNTKTHIGVPNHEGVTRSIVTPQRNQVLTGNAMCLMGEATKNDWGLYIVKTDTLSIETKVPMIDIIKNDPKELIVILPSLAVGTYWVEVRTYSDAVGKRLVQELRTARFKHTITVEQE